MERREHYMVLREDDRYEISNLGNIRNRRTGRVLRPRPNFKGGYGRVNIGGRDYYVHRLVAGNFFDIDEERMSMLDVNHIDGDPTNNFIGNLEWCTRSENIKHAYSAGLKPYSATKIVRCRFCKYRNSNPYCYDRPDDFFCADGERP